MKQILLISEAEFKYVLDSVGDLTSATTVVNNIINERIKGLDEDLSRHKKLSVLKIKLIYKRSTWEYIPYIAKITYKIKNRK
jgi:hypothetical protein